jgi:hypothetical protein
MSRAIFVLERATSLVEHMAISGIYCELNPLIGADLLSAADLCNQARAMIEIEGAPSGSDAAPQQSNTFPRLRIFFGSSARLRVRINSISAGERDICSQAFFSRPIPCSAETAPPRCASGR